MKGPHSPTTKPSFRPGPIESRRLPASAPAQDVKAFPDLPEALLSLGEVRREKAGALIFTKGDPADECFLVRAGEVIVFTAGKDGLEVELTRIRPGEWFGEAIIFAAASFPVSARAGESGAGMYSFKREAILDSLSSAPDAASFFVSLLAQKCLSLNRRLDELTIMPARQRLARYLSSLCDRASCGHSSAGLCDIKLPAKKRQIASELAMAPETFSRTVKSLESDGIIHLNIRSVSVIDCIRLRKEAEG